MPFTIPELLEDFPALLDLVGAIQGLIAAEATATTFAAKQKLTEPVQEKLAALIDTIKAQAAS